MYSQSYGPAQNYNNYPTYNPTRHAYQTPVHASDKYERIRFEKE